MILTLVLITGLEILAISCFILGHVLGRQFERKVYEKTKPDKIKLPDDMLDPVTPEDQRLVEKLERDEKYAHSEAKE